MIERSLPGTAVIAVTHNSSGMILDWLRALKNCSGAPPLELCVVDAGSRAEEVSFLREHVAPSVDELIELPNVGFGRACNAGVAATDARVLVFTNPDTRVQSLPDAIVTGASIEGTLLSAMALEPDGALIPFGFEHLPSFSWQARGLLLGQRGDVFRFTAEDPAWVPGATLVIARSDFEATGGFPRDIFMYYEDADLCAKHTQRGGRIRVDPSFIVKHGGGSSAPLSVELDGVGCQSGRIFAARHGHRWHAVALYVLLVAWYMPRRVVLTLLRRAAGRPTAPTIRHLVLSLLFPSIVKRRLGYSAPSEGRP